jgi:transposase
MNSSHSPTGERYLAVDLPKYYLLVGGVNARQEIVLPPRRLELKEWPAWAKEHLQKTDALVSEATTNAWDFYDQVVPLVGRVVVANAGRVRLIAEARVKTDKHDVLCLARLLAAKLIPEVWVPPSEVRELRSLLAHRRRLVKMQTMLKNRLHSLLHRHYLLPPAGDPFLAQQQTWGEKLALSPTERLHMRHDLATLRYLEPQIAEVDLELSRLSTQEPWSHWAPYLFQLPGFGLIVTMTVLAAIGDITRFPTDKQLVGYSGLGVSVHDSGLLHRSGHITKEGRKELPWVLVEAAWQAVECHPYWQAEYARLVRRLGPNQAIVAIARRLLVAVWHVLSERAADCQARPEMVAFKLMTWSWKLTKEQRGGMTSRQFIRYQVMRLKLGADLTHLTTGKNTRHALASVDEVLALRPELRSAD